MTAPCGVVFRSHDGHTRVCNIVAGHIGSHQYLRAGVCSEPFPSGTVPGLVCARSSGHEGDHDAGVFTWPADEPDQVPVVQCGEKLTWYEPGTETCWLRAGHRGLHASGSGDYIGGRTVEDVLVEAFQRISELETRLSTLTGISEQGTNAPVPVTHGDLNHAMERLEKSVTGRLSGLESLIRDVSTKVSQLHVMPQQCDGYFGPAGIAKVWQCTRAAGHDGWHSDADSGSLWDDSGAFLEAPAGEPPRGVCGAVRSFNGVDHVCQMDPGHVGLHRDAAEYVNALLVWNAQGAWPDPSV